MRVRRRPWGCTAGVCLACMAHAGSARADLDPSGSWLLAGVNAGATGRDGEYGFLGGVELSAARTDNDLKWYGAFLDVVVDLERESARLSFGPELGYRIFGVDGGFVLESGPDRTRYGMAIRPLLTFVFIDPYARLGWLSEGAGVFTEFGVLLKYPLSRP